MSLFLALLTKTVPLYFSLILGFISTRFLSCNKESIAKILFYILGPLIALNATMSVELNFDVVFIPTFFFVFSSIIAFVLLFVFKKVWSDNTSNLLAFASSTGNTGHIGIPLAIILFEPSLVDVFIFAVLGTMLYQNSVGYFITAKGSFTAKQSLKKVIQLPVLYAFILGITLNILGIKVPDIFLNYVVYLKGCYAILGMMFLGMGMEKLKSAKAFDFKFISYALLIKFLVWPALVLIFIFIDKNFLFLLNDGFYKVMFLYSIVPLAGNTVTIATLLNVKPEMMSLTVFISILLSLFYIPFAIFLFLN